MRFHTKRYDINKIDTGADWCRDIHYEISLKDGYCFSDGSALDYAEDVEELQELIASIEIAE